MKVLVTGGAGFIGSRVARKLLQSGHEVTVLDSFSPQVHGGSSTLPDDLASHVRLFHADVRDEHAWKVALEAQEGVVHLAAETGTGQSMYQVRHYADVNIQGTSLLIEALLTGGHKIQTLVVASSRSIYGEGAYLCKEHGLVYPKARATESMKGGDFEPKCPACNCDVLATATKEEAPFRPCSFYGLTKQVQEQMSLMYATALGMNGFALRYQNVYGPGQSLKNPYTGILAIFSNQARANKPIYIFEDGKESRDFVHVDDVVEATLRCVEAPAQAPVALNIGTGVPVTVLEVVKSIVDFFGSHSSVTVNGAFREGDIRHNYADLGQLRITLGYEPSRRFAEGIREFLAWAATQPLPRSSYENSLDEMRQAGLMHG